jgi:biopolymer transport protein ExbD
VTGGPQFNKRSIGLETAGSESLRRDIFGKVFSGRRGGLTLRMAPMIDMIFLLLIFFLVAAKWRPQEDFLPLSLPAAEAQPSSVGTPEPLMIYIRPAENGCEVQIGQAEALLIRDDNAEADFSALMDKIQQCLAAQKRFAADPVEIVCDPLVKWEHLTKVYNTLLGSGLTNIIFATTE